eukprot:6147365-Alexandrium_andersonii.AAC.1
MGFGLAKFCPASATDPVALEDRRLLRLVMDQGSTGASAAGFCEQRLRCMTVFDPLHRVWNDAKDAVAACGLSGARCQSTVAES